MAPFNGTILWRHKFWSNKFIASKNGAILWRHNMVLFNGAILWHVCTRHNVPVLHPYMIILCDPIWQVKSRSCEVGFQQRAISFSPFNDRSVFCLYRQCLYTVRPRDVDSVSVKMCTADWRHIPRDGHVCFGCCWGQACCLLRHLQSCPSNCNEAARNP